MEQFARYKFSCFSFFLLYDIVDSTLWIIKLITKKHFLTGIMTFLIKINGVIPLITGKPRENICKTINIRIGVIKSCSIMVKRGIGTNEKKLHELSGKIFIRILRS